jgi:hypothetical protein
MSGRGLHLALDDAELGALRTLSDADKADHVGETLEATKFGTSDACETDKSWAYIHAALTGSDPDGDLGIPGAPAPKTTFLDRLFGRGAPQSIARSGERAAILGTDVVLASPDYFIGLVPQDRVHEVADALARIPVEELGDRVRAVHGKFQSSGDADECAEYAMGWYPALVEFLQTSATAGKNVIFTVDF